MYLFMHASPALRGALGACHALELPFVFGTLEAPMQDRFAGTGPAVEALSAAMMSAWTAFARTGSPGAETSAWPPFVLPRRATRCFGGVEGGAVRDAPRDDERAAW
jgi:para-nitrobenzyl esterase